MDNSMNKRVYGVLGISSLRANWNADFSGYPKTLSDGRIFGSDKAFKYPMKKMWDNEGQKVLYIKSMNFKTDKKGEVSLIPRTLRERYESLFDAEDFKDVKKVLTNLMASVDVKNFGATFAEAGCNIAITGAVQIGQGMNKYDDAAVTEQPILSPFRDGSDKKGKEGEDAKNSTIGTKIMTDEAHYFYPFVVNPSAYKELVSLGVTEGYTEDDYANFKRTAITAATAYDTNSKSGCENEFAVFIETEPNVYLPNMSEYVSFTKDGQTNIIKMEFADVLAALGDKIKSVEIYYNPQTTKLSGSPAKAKLFNILTQQEV